MQICCKFFSVHNKIWKSIPALPPNAAVPAINSNTEENIVADDFQESFSCFTFFYEGLC